MDDTKKTGGGGGDADTVVTDVNDGTTTTANALMGDGDAATLYKCFAHGWHVQNLLSVNEFAKNAAPYGLRLVFQQSLSKSPG